MELRDIPFGITDWQQIVPDEHMGQAGLARWRTRQFGAHLSPGMSYQVADDAEPHRSRTARGATLFIVD